LFSDQAEVIFSAAHAGMLLIVIALAA